MRPIPVAVRLAGWSLAVLTAFAACDDPKTDDERALPADSISTDRVPSGESRWGGPGTGLILAEGEIALGSDGMIDLRGIEINPVIAGSYGMGVNDVSLTGDGRNAAGTGACPPPCLVPGNPVGCGTCPSRGTFGAGQITAVLTLTNRSDQPKLNAAEGQLGICSLEDLSVCTQDSDCIPVNLSPGPLGLGGNGERGCNGLPVLGGGTVGDPLDVSTIPDGIMNGFCQDGTTACAAAQSDPFGYNSTCGGIGVCSDNLAACTPGPDKAFGTGDDVRYLCGTPATATCNPGATPLIGDGRCWSGCGVCDNGRNLLCASFVYGGSNLNAGPATGDTKCTGAPYSIANASNINVANLDSILVGAVPVGGGVMFNFVLNAGNASYCVHRFQIRENPFGNVDDSAAGDVCNTSCGDAVIAGLNGEICEPHPDPLDITGFRQDRGCTDPNPVCDTTTLPCAQCVAFCGDGAIGTGEVCDTASDPADITPPIHDVGCTDALPICNACGVCEAGAPGTCPSGLCDAGEDETNCPADCSVCGSGTCSATENPCSCPADCAADSCGDGCCGATENASTCNADCPDSCGDTFCTGAEDNCTCASDCLPLCGDGCCDPTESPGCIFDCATVCGNAICEVGESNCTCPSDCIAVCGDGCCNPVEMFLCAPDCGAFCGNAICEAGETQCSCPGDCPFPTCGDGCCDPTESLVCPADCGTVCGNAMCEAGEDACSCPGDCTIGVCGDGCCGGGEDTCSCELDCGDFCGDACCTSGEDPGICGIDCIGFCGDGFCNFDQGEDISCCDVDCGDFCGDGCCTGGEDPCSCDIDCGPCMFCGDGFCDPPEDDISCPLDCP